MQSGTEGLIEGGGLADRLGKISRIGGFLVFLIIIGLAVLPTAVTVGRIRSGIGDFSEEVVKYCEANLPPIRLQGGKAIVDADQPVILPKPGQEPEGFHKQFAFIIDTTGKTEKIPREYQSGALLTEDTLWIKDANGRIQEIPLEKVQEMTGEFTLDGKFLREHKDGWVKIAVWILAGAVLLWNLFIKPIQALLLAILATIASPRESKLSFGAGFKVGAVALIPAVGVQVAQGLVGFDLPFGLAIYAGIAGLGTWFCARAARPAVPAGGTGPMDGTGAAGTGGPGGDQAIGDRAR
jgi:hypothetical protein